MTGKYQCYILSHHLSGVVLQFTAIAGIVILRGGTVQKVFTMDNVDCTLYTVYTVQCTVYSVNTV